MKILSSLLILIFSVSVFAKPGSGPTIPGPQATSDKTSP